MISTPQGTGDAFHPKQVEPKVSFDLEELRQKISNEEYLSAAIQRIALVLSNELLKVSVGRIYHERQRKRRK
jgi:hypothetical protein